MCLCICCGSSKCCTYIAAIYSGIQCLLFIALNLVLILAYSCVIYPPDKENLTPGFEFIEQVWSWFFYDYDNCQHRYEDNYVEPVWISEIPLYFQTKSNLSEEVSPKANYAYQITFLILHFCWFFSSFMLFYGNVRKRWQPFLPWIIIGLAIIGLDTITGAFYLKLMDDTNPGWDDGRAIFSMQFLYFRGFLLYIFNIIALSIVCVTFCKVYNKRKKQQKLQANIGANTTIEIPITVISPEKNSEPGPSEPIHITEVEETYQRDETPGPDQVAYLRHPYQEEPRKPVPLKYRPFSYTNPAYRPTDPHDVEGMKKHAPGPPVIRQSSFEQRTLDQMREYDNKIPRANIRHENRYED